MYNDHLLHGKKFDLDTYINRFRDFIWKSRKKFEKGEINIAEYRSEIMRYFKTIITEVKGIAFGKEDILKKELQIVDLEENMDLLATGNDFGANLRYRSMLTKNHSFKGK